ncbi:MAG: Exodeoxyribonuclease III [Clostridiales bacterium 38_11]|nr:MAG: Exodeoxyribonuclease III [Clostridiales bacterium 38_11]HBH13056.1 exodeoxyribonuclease III [Clostridiales bacterium]
MKIYSWNVNGIRAIQKKGFLKWISQEQPDILCLQETKAQKDQLDDELINIPGYHSYFHSAEKKGYSGTAIYSKIKPLEVWTGLPEERFNTEGRTIIAEYEEFILMNIYFPNGKQREERLQFKMDFYKTFQKYAIDLVKQGKHLIVCGDYNTAHKEIDLTNPESNNKISGFLPEERAWMDSFSESGFIDVFRYFYPDKIEYTWWSYMFKAREKNVGWRIDYFFINNQMLDKVKSIEIHHEVLGSDHCPLSLTL